MNNLYVLKPTDPFKRKNLPPSYKSDLYDNYTNKLGIAMSRSSILSDSKEELTGSEKHRSRRNLTNAEHHTMQKNHVFLAAKMSELPHHYFKMEHNELQTRSVVPNMYQSFHSQQLKPK